MLMVCACRFDSTSSNIVRGVIEAPLEEDVTPLPEPEDDEASTDDASEEAGSPDEAAVEDVRDEVVADPLDLVRVAFTECLRPGEAGVE